MSGTPMMNLGPNRSFRSGNPCADGHRWIYVCAEPGRPGYTRHRCPVCGEQEAIKDAEPAAMREINPRDVARNPLEARVTTLEQQVAELFAKLEDRG